MALSVYQMAAVSRPFNLGMLYDCRSDTLLSGITLWDEQTLQKVRKCQPQESSGYEIVTEDTLSRKTKLLELNADLRVSLLCGAIPLSGSAQYVENHKTSISQQRVTFAYRCTTRFEQLTMDQLGRNNMQHMEVFEHGTATHVVTGILYGGHAFCVFEDLASETPNTKNVSGNIDAAVPKNCIMRLLTRLAGLKGEANFKIPEEDIETANQFHCKFYADFLSTQIPRTFDEAVPILRDLPTLLGNSGEKAVPKTVWLYPLHLLDPRAAKIKRMIDNNVADTIELLLERLQESMIRCSDILQSPALQKFSCVQKDVLEFRNAVSGYQRKMETTLQTLIPRHRGGENQEEELQKVLPSPQYIPDCDAVLTAFKGKAHLLQSYLKKLAPIRCATRADLNFALLEPDVHNIICFVINIGYCVAHPAIFGDLQLKQSFGGETPERCSQLLLEAGQSLRNCVPHFKCLYDANKDRDDVQFLVVEGSDRAGPFGGYMCLYREGVLINSDYEPPSAPGVPVDSNRSHNSLHLAWSPPEWGQEEVVKYKVAYQHCDEEEWASVLTDTNNPEITIRELPSSTKYKVKVRAIGDIIHSAYSAESKIISTRPCSPPSKVSAQRQSSGRDCVQWSAPEITCQSVDYYIVLRFDTGCNQWLEPIQTKSRECRIEVASGDSYKYKIVAVCSNGESLESESVMTERLTEAEPVEDCFSNSAPFNAEITGAVSSLYPSLACMTVHSSPEFLMPKSLEVGGDGVRELRQLNVTKALYDEDNNKYIYDFGDENVNAREKTLLLFGTGHMSNFINGLVNYIMRVSYDDTFRFCITKSDIHGDLSQRADAHWPVCIYNLYYQDGFRISYTLTIIILPEFRESDQDGSDTFKKYSEQIRQALSDVPYIDVVGLVIQAAVRQLTPLQEYMCQFILSLFGKDVAESTFLLMDDADAGIPNVINVIENAGISIANMYKFHNSAIYSERPSQNSTKGKDTRSDDGRLFWDLGIKLMGTFLLDVCAKKSKDLRSSEEILFKHSSIADLYDGMRACLNMLKHLKGKVTDGASSQRELRARFEDAQVKLIGLEGAVAQSWASIGELALCRRPLPALEYEGLNEEIARVIREVSSIGE